MARRVTFGSRPGGRAKKPARPKVERYAADTSFDFGFNVSTPKARRRAKKPGGGS